MNAKQLLFLCVIWPLSFSFLTAQSSTGGVWDGIQLYQDGTYDDAIGLLSSLIEAKVGIPKADLPAAHYFLAQAYMEADLAPELKDRYPTGLLKAYNHLLASASLDTSGQFASLIQESTELLSHSLYQEGARSYNREDYGRAISFLTVVGKLQPGASDWQLTRGYSFVQAADTVEAIDTWQRLVDRYMELKLDADAEVGVDRAFALIADMKQKKGSPSMALRAIRTGQLQFPDSEILRQAEISLYRSFPGLLADETGKLNLSYENQPRELPARVAYAGLLEEIGHTELALEIYQGVLIEDSLNYRANLSLAAHYLNEAVSIKEEIENLNEPDSITHPLKQVMIFYLQNAYPHFLRLHKLEPQEEEFLHRLWAISHYLDLPQKTYYQQLWESIKEDE